MSIDRNLDAKTPPPLLQSIEVLRWIHTKMDKLPLPGFGESKRMQLAGACWHVAMEHSQAIVVLVEEALHGSALAMQRPLFEAYLRGMWLMHAASDAEVDAAGRDEFPRDIKTILNGVERAGAGHLVELKDEWWPRLCSLTHTGYGQIGARLTPAGLGYAYDDVEIAQALGWADGIGLLVVVAVSHLAGDQATANEARELMVSLAGGGIASRTEST